MNSRFSIAVHILTLLVSTRQERLTSEFIASSLAIRAMGIGADELAFLVFDIHEGRDIVYRSPKDVTLGNQTRTFFEETAAEVISQVLRTLQAHPWMFAC